MSSLLLVVGCVGGSDSGSLADGGTATQGDDTPSVVYATGPAPDLVVSMLANPPASAAIGSGFSSSDTVTNQGSADAGSSYNKYYLSTNGTTPQYFLGNRSVAALTIGAMDSGNASLTVPGGVPQGSYRFMACADSGPGNSGRTSQVDESNEANNCTAAASSIVINGADLTESDVSVSPTTFNVATNSLTVYDTVHNVGTAAAAASITRWWLSTDNVKDSNDAFIRNCTNGGTTPGRNMNGIAAGGSNAGRASTFPLCVRDANGLHSPAAGTYYVIACADSTQLVSELSEGNNCAASTNTLTISGATVDLIESAVGNPPATGAAGTQFQFTDTVQNIGGDPAPSSFTKFYLSTNGTSLTAYLATRAVTALNAGQTNPGTTTITIPEGVSGTYKVVACADSGPGTAGRTSQIAESNETNNCKASTGSITIGSPDLVITTISDPPPTGSVGTQFTVTDTTKNIGTAAAGSGTAAFYNKYYLSTNGTLPVYLLAPGAAADGLAPGISENVSTLATIPSNTAPGLYWLLGCADSGPGISGRTSQIVESNENNNCTKSAIQILVN